MSCRPWAWLALLPGALLAMAGCASDPSSGYSFASTYPANVKTIAVPVFDNLTFYPGLEVQLTEAVIKQLQASSGLRVVGAENADTRLHVVITDVRMRRLTLQRTTGLVQEEALQMSIDFDWRDNRSGKTIISRTNFAAADTFVPARPSGERIEVGQLGVIQRLAHDIVAEMRSSW